MTRRILTWLLLRPFARLAVADDSEDHFEKVNLLDSDLDEVQKSKHYSLRAIASDIRSGR